MVGAGRSLLMLITIGLAVLALGGCAAPIAAVAIPVAAGAPVAAENVGAGRTESFWAARYDDVVRAAFDAADRLSFEIEVVEIGDDRAFLRFADLRGMTLSLTIERRTDTVTSVRFDVGWTGSTGMAHLIGRQIVEELNEAGAFVVDWSLDAP